MSVDSTISIVPAATGAVIRKADPSPRSIPAGAVPIAVSSIAWEISRGIVKPWITISRSSKVVKFIYIGRRLIGVS